MQEYQAYSELSQRSQAGCIGAKNVKLFLREPLSTNMMLISNQARCGTQNPPPNFFVAPLDITSWFFNFHYSIDNAPSQADPD
jgi:hypothetical protein